MEYVIGKYYKVRCVFTKFGSRTLWVPVMGHLHDDIEHLDFKYQHLHINHSFLTNRDINILYRDRYEMRFHNGRLDYHGVVVWEWICFGCGLNAEFGKKYCNCEGTKPVIIYKKRRYQRHREPFPNVIKLSPYIGTKLNGTRCPHKGYDLKDVKCDAEGMKQCPLHGLTFKDGVCVSLGYHMDKSGYNLG